MMGLGYLGSSSSSSSASSNLSPLAPPFTVDRSNHNKPVINSNLISHFNDPSYGVPFSSSWSYSQSSAGRQEFSGDLPRTTTSVPCSQDGHGGYMNSETAGNWCNGNGKQGSEQQWCGVYPSPKRVSDSLSYNLSEAKPFYPPPPYASKDDVPLVSFSEPGYDLLSTSGVESDYNNNNNNNTRSLSYNPQLQDSCVWSAPAPAQGKKVETDDSFFSEEPNIAASLSYNNYLNQGGGYGKERSSKSKDDSSLFYYADIIRRANNNTNTTMDAINNQMPSSKGGGFRAFPMFSECHPLIQQQSSHEDVWNTFEKRYHMFDHDHSSSTSLVIKPPPPVSASGGGSFFPSKQLSFQIGTTSHSHSHPPSSKQKEEEEEEEEEDKKSAFEFKAKTTSFQVPPEITIPNVNTTENVNNPAEDSPCWKGAPSSSSSHFLPFNEPPSKKLQTHHSFSDKIGKQDASEIFILGGDDAIKPNKGHAADVNSHSKFPNPEIQQPLYVNGDTADSKHVNASGILKSLYNLSELLLLHCSNDEFAQNDRDTLDHVLRNLGACSSMSHTRTPQQNTSKVTNETTSGVLSLHHDDDQDKNVEKLLQHSSLRAEAKDDTMVQAIKKVLDENVECELPSETLMYKNLWLEAEAELCSLSFRARFERLKKSHKSKSTTDDASAAIKEISSCNDVPSMTHVDDVEAAVMARFSILKLREDPPISVNLPVNPTPASVLAKDNGVDPWVMDRFNILKRRGESNAQDKQLTDSGPMHFQDEEEEEEEEEEAVGSGGSDWEHILKDDFSWRLT